jgi:hypothetical protein
MEWWITTKQLLILQDAISQRMKNQPNGAFEHPMANIDTLWDQGVIPND